MAFCLAVDAVIAAERQPGPPMVQLIITNAVVRTIDTNRPTAEAIAISGNRITAVGIGSEIAQLAGPETRVIDARGKLVLPGFNDAHVHFLSGLSLIHI